MPEKLVRSAFQHQFKTQKFTLNEDTAFALNLGSIEDLRARCSNVRDLSRLLARATFYDGEHFGSLAQQFRVSVETMAIRLEELDLVGL